MRGLRHVSTVAILLAASVALAAPPGVRFPAAKAVTGDELYVIDADAELFIRASPDGLITITSEAGPITIRGRFAGSVETETRKYTSKYLYLIEAKGTGKVDLFIIPKGVATDADIVVKTIDVKAGAAPQPPPEPQPKPIPPTPKPDPKPTPAAGPIWVLVVEETSMRTAGTAAVVANLTYWQGLAAKGSKWRHYDKDDATAVKNGYAKEAAKVGLPALIVLDKDGDVVRSVKLPTTTAAIDKLLAEVQAK